MWHITFSFDGEFISTRTRAHAFTRNFYEIGDTIKKLQKWECEAHNLKELGIKKIEIVWEDEDGNISEYRPQS